MEPACGMARLHSMGHAVENPQKGLEGRKGFTLGTDMLREASAGAGGSWKAEPSGISVPPSCV